MHLDDCGDSFPEPVEGPTNNLPLRTSTGSATVSRPVPELVEGTTNNLPRRNSAGSAAASSPLPEPVEGHPERTSSVG